jgi:PAS domain S-box-containing protein
VAALGYDDVGELLGRGSHETIHFRHPDGRPYPAAECPMLRPRTTGETIHSSDDWFVRRDGSMFPVEYWSAPIEMPAGRGAVVAFTDIEERRRTEQALRERDAILSSLGQPVYVGTHDGVITYANPAAAHVLGFGHPSELIGRDGHALVHYRRVDGSPFPVDECPLAKSRETGQAISVDEDWWVRKDGSMIPTSYTAVPIETPSGFGIAVAFNDMTSRRAAERAASESRQRATLEASLDAVISIDDRGHVTYFNAAAERIFGYRRDDVIGRELAETIIPPSLRNRHREGFARYLATGEPHMLGRRIEIPARRADGTEFPAELTVTRAGPPDAPSFTGFVRDITDRQRAQQDLEAARVHLKSIADEQAALRHIAMLVARGSPPLAVFDAVCEETGRLIGATNVNLAHFTPDGFNLTMSGWSLRQNHVPTGTRLPLEGDTINVIIQRTRAPARVDSYVGVEGDLASLLRRLGIRSEVGAPVVVEGTVWGALIAGSDKAEPLPDGSERRVASFAELIATAVSNATTRAELIAAQRRVIEAADAARKQVTRDLHDGAQQQFVSTVIGLKLAREKVSSDPERAIELLDTTLQEANRGIESLRELAAGLHPALLTSRGVAAALDALAARLPIPVSLDVADLRLTESIEASIYFFCSEALTNVVKHSGAQSASVLMTMEGDRCVVEVRDDGVGGAQPRPDATGLIGLRDRIGALDGTLEVVSPLGGGTVLRASIPLSPAWDRRSDDLDG